MLERHGVSAAAVLVERVLQVEGAACEADDGRDEEGHGVGVHGRLCCCAGERARLR